MNWQGGMPATGRAVMTVLCHMQIAVVVWTIVALVSRDDGTNRSTTAAAGPEEILDGHLARVESDAATKRRTAREAPRGSLGVYLTEAVRPSLRAAA